MPSNRTSPPTPLTAWWNTKIIHLLIFYLACASTTAFFPSSPPSSRRSSCPITRSCRTHTSLTAEFTSTSFEYALDPESDEARELCLSHLGISETSYRKLCDLAKLVVSWNERLNLISRKDCTVDVVFGRHILPSIALIGMKGWDVETGDECSIFEEQASILRMDGGNDRVQVIDVGSGGGFPGLPLAIVNPSVEFTLVDSVGKKIRAVSEMIDELGLDNVCTYVGRAEEIIDLQPKLRQNFDICVGRSVTALPRFCFWIAGLLKKEHGKLLYIIGGDVEKIVQESTSADVKISNILGGDNYSDKNVLLFSEENVETIAAGSGEKKQKRGAPGTGRHRKKSNVTKSNKKLVKGAWAKRDNSERKQRGAEDFKRYSVN